ncbi:MAG: acetyl-CoA carboxylase biotin carboxyl carrier protein [bacterium]
MDIKGIKKVIELMKENELSEFELAEEGFRITIKRRNGGEPQVMISAPAQSPMAMVPAAAAAPAKPEVPENTVAIKSPMVGTFYRAASPEAEPFVSLGKEVEEDTVVCIIEAMKVMNEIKAEVKGVIRKVLVENATPVEFGQALFQVEPRVMKT